MLTRIKLTLELGHNLAPLTAIHLWGIAPLPGEELTFLVTPKNEPHYTVTPEPVTVTFTVQPRKFRMDLKGTMLDTVTIHAVVVASQAAQDCMELNRQLRSIGYYREIA